MNHEAARIAIRGSLKTLLAMAVGFAVGAAWAAIRYVELRSMGIEVGAEFDAVTKSYGAFGAMAAGSFYAIFTILAERPK